ncbi:MAG: prolyl-tRNA synthetase [Thermotogaceae bacterium]|jgi:prolyl-tRNA synthetase|nr:prolyl-tRNA synthetase [Thermotogaceae bacterium]
MLFSKLYAPTIKEKPADSETISYELLTRGGFIRKVAAGIYTYLPLGWRVIKKITKIVEEEMDKIGAQEFMMPIIQQAEIWKESGRWEDYGPEMMKLSDRHGREFTLGPTHEEMITFIVRNELRSYKQLPLILYQINQKYRDEIRPRFGLMRAREFIMKDAYSFHSDEKSLEETYQDFYRAYSKICERLELNYISVEADTGAIGGTDSHEFIILASTGESDIYVCDSCGYSASEERAQSKIPENIPEEIEPLEEVPTPNVKTIEDVSEFLKVSKEKIVKSLLYVGRNGYVMALIRGDYELNESKLKSLLKDQTLRLATPEEVQRDFGVPIGFIGPVGIDGVKVQKVADLSIKNLNNFVVGGMKEDYHYINTNLNRDFTVELWGDIRTVKEGEGCPKCGNQLRHTKGIEVGHIFKLGTKYSEKLNGYFVDEEGKNKPYLMGCYGWGISRTLAAIVEQLHDDNGIIWPISVAPYTVEIVIVNTSDEEQRTFGFKLYEILKSRNCEVLLDDRETSAGFKFKDSDLIGFPIRITVGKKLKDGKIEIKKRYEEKGVEVSIKKGLEEVVDLIEKTIEEYSTKFIQNNLTIS